MRRVFLALAAALTLAGCGGQELRTPPPEAPVGNPERGKQLIEEYGCGSCHTIPGIRDADATVGPPLTEFGKRSYIAGALPNTAENLAEWIENPQEIEPGTAMPNLGVSGDEAIDIAAYLHSLD